MARPVCVHPWKAGACGDCPLRGSQRHVQAPKAKPAPTAQSEAKDAPKSPSEALTRLMARMHQAGRALTPEERATVRGQALTAHAEELTAEYRRRCIAALPPKLP